MSHIDRVRSDPAFLERFEILELLGAGGMGEVYRGVQKALGRPVAIKFLSAQLEQGSDFAERFVQEAKLAAGVIHSAVVVVFDYGLAAGTPYLVSELVEGRSLSAVLSGERRLAVSEVLSIAGDVLDGLAAIHKRGIVHRDLKPENVLVGGDEPPRAKITDFGIAKNVTEGSQTRSGVVLGTPAYLAPEQVAGDPVSPATDLYAFSLILHRLVTGRPVFQANTALELMHQHVNKPPELGSEIDGDLRELLEHGLVKDPRARIASAKAYRERLDVVGRAALTRGTLLRGVRSPSKVQPVAPPHSPDTATAVGTGLPAVPAGATTPTVPIATVPTSRTLVPDASATRASHRLLAGVAALAIAAAALAVTRQVRVTALAPSSTSTPAAPSAARDAAALFASIRSDGRLAALPLDRAGSDAGARAVDEKLLDFLEAGMAGPYPARSAGPDGAELVARLADCLRCDNHQDLLAADRLLDSFFAQTTADARALHPGNALAAVHALLELKSARNPPEMAVALHRTIQIAAAHHDRPLGRWAHASAAGAIEAVELEPPVELGDSTSGPVGEVAARWPHLNGVFTGEAKSTRERWESEDAKPDVRRAILLIQLFLRLDELDRPGHRWTRSWSVPYHVKLDRLRAALTPEGHLRDTKPPEIVTHLEGQLGGATEVSLSSPLSAGLVAWLAYALQVRWPDLAAKVEADGKNADASASAAQVSPSPEANPTPASSVAASGHTTSAALDDETALDVLEAAIAGNPGTAVAGPVAAVLQAAGQALAGPKPDFARAMRTLHEFTEKLDKRHADELPGTIWVFSALLDSVVEETDGGRVYQVRCMEQSAHSYSEFVLGAWCRLLVQVLANHTDGDDVKKAPFPSLPSPPVMRWPATRRVVELAALKLDELLTRSKGPHVRRAVLLSEILIKHGEVAAGKSWLETDGVPYTVKLAELLGRCSDRSVKERVEAEHPAAEIDPQSELSSPVLVALARCVRLERAALIERVERENAVPALAR